MVLFFVSSDYFIQQKLTVPPEELGIYICKKFPSDADSWPVAPIRLWEPPTNSEGQTHGIQSFKALLNYCH